MRIAVRHRNFMVIDDLVEPSQFQLLYESLKRAKYRARTGWAPIWSLAEVRGVRSSPFTSDGVTRDFGDPATIAYSIFVEAFRQVLGDVEYLTGKQGESWAQFNGNAVVFPPHGALNWHSDKKYAASYSYYCQAEWQRRWGGELLVLEEKAPDWDRADEQASPGAEEPAVDDIGYFVAPIANRVVVIRGATPHRIAAVSAAAGEHHRMSITGFFQARDPE